MSEHEILADGDGDGSDEVRLDLAMDALLRATLQERADLAGDAPAFDVVALETRRAARGGAGRRRAVMIGLAAAACVAVLAGVVAVTARRSVDPDVTTANPAQILASLHDLPQRARDANSFAYDLTVWSGPGARCAVDTRQSGRVDLRARLVAIEEGDHHVVLDDAGAGWLDSAQLPASWGVTTPWLRATLAEAVRLRFATDARTPLMAKVGDVGPSAVEPDVSKQFDALQAAASDVQVHGREQVRGVDTSRVTIVLDAAAFAAYQERTKADAVALAVQVGLLSDAEAAKVATATTPGSAVPRPAGDLQVEAWVGDDGLVRRLVSTHTQAPQSAGAAPTSLTTTLELFDYDRAPVSAPAAGEVTELGSLPASILRPLDDPQSPCGQAPVEKMSDCTAPAFDAAAAGQTVDLFIATLPRTYYSLITPNGWFDACSPMTSFPTGVPTTPYSVPVQREPTMELAVLLAQACCHADEARRQRFLDATGGDPALAGVAASMRLYLAATACPILRLVTAPVDVLLGRYRAAPITGAPPVEAYRRILTWAEDPAAGLCPP